MLSDAVPLDGRQVDTLRGAEVSVQVEVAVERLLGPLHASGFARRRAPDHPEPHRIDLIASAAGRRLRCCAVIRRPAACERLVRPDPIERRTARRPRAWTWSMDEGRP